MATYPNPSSPTDLADEANFLSDYPALLMIRKLLRRVVVLLLLAAVPVFAQTDQALAPKIEPGAVFLYDVTSSYFGLVSQICG